MSSTKFQTAKTKALTKLTIAQNNGLADTAIIPILEKINACACYYTTSSCAGRIQILELSALGDKKQAKVLGKWHSAIDYKWVQQSLLSAEKGMLWMFAQAPIFHVVAEDFSAANTLVKLGISAGFKHSSLKGKGTFFLVELMSTERLDAPIGLDGELYASSKLLKLWLNIANNIMKKADEKLNRLFLEISTL